MGSRAGNRAWLREWPSLRVMEFETTESGWACSKHHRGTTMEHYAGIDVSLESASLCVVDATGRIVREAKVASEPEVLIGWFSRLGLEAGPRRGIPPVARSSPRHRPRQTAGDVRVAARFRGAD